MISAGELQETIEKMPNAGSRTLKWAAATSGLLALQAALACREPAGVPLRPELDIVASFSAGAPWAIAASPDGALFLAADGGLFRAAPGDDRHWVRLASGAVEAQGLYAPSADVLFVVLGTGSVYRWTPQAGLEEMVTPVSDSVVVDYDYIYGISLMDIWGRSASDVYAVGRGGTVLHFDGAAWAIEAIPRPTWDPGDWLVSVSVSDDAVYTAGRTLLTKRGGRWSSLPFPPGEFDTYCGRQAVVVQGDAVLVGGGEEPCLIRRTRDGTWEVLSNRLRQQGFQTPGIGGGARQADGAALFWSTAYYLPAVAEVRGRGVRVYTFPSLKWFGGAATVGDFLYVTGTRGDTTVVARTRRR